MAQRISIVCDQHAAREEDVPGATWTLAVGPPGGQVTTWEVDACPECAKPFRDLAKFLADLGRPATGKTRRGPGRPSEPDPSLPIEDRTCPVCGFVSVNRKAMRSHVRQAHESSLAEVEANGGNVPPPPPPDYTCAECGKTFSRSQSLGAHRSRAHGVPGASKDAAAYRARVAERG